MYCKYVTIKRFAELTGYTEQAVYSKMNCGVWIEGRHYRRAADKKPLMNLEEYEKWVEGTSTPELRLAANR